MFSQRMYRLLPLLYTYRAFARHILTVRHPDRTKRVKDAKTEAQKEIEDYRKQKEEEFKKFEAEVSWLFMPRASYYQGGLAVYWCSRWTNDMSFLN